MNNFFADDASTNGNFWKSDDQMRELQELDGRRFDVRPGSLIHHDFGLWDRVLSSCLSSASYVTACTVPKMVGSSKKGVIINITITSNCSRGNAGQAAFSARKGKRGIAS